MNRDEQLYTGQIFKQGYKIRRAIVLDRCTNYKILPFAEG